MNTKRFVLTTLAVFGVLFVTDFLIHGVLLEGIYEQTAQLWRPKAEMHGFGWVMLLSQLLFAAALTYVFPKGYERKGAAEGIRYGICISLLFGSHTLGMYAYMPVPPKLIIAWILSMSVQLVLSGVVISVLYKGGKR